VRAERLPRARTRRLRVATWRILSMSSAMVQNQSHSLGIGTSRRWNLPRRPSRGKTSHAEADSEKRAGAEWPATTATEWGSG
jgi:hypothetical protein